MRPVILWAPCREYLSVTNTDRGRVIICSMYCELGNVGFIAAGSYTDPCNPGHTHRLLSFFGHYRKEPRISPRCNNPKLITTAQSPIVLSWYQKPASRMRIWIFAFLLTLRNHQYTDPSKLNVLLHSFLCSSHLSAVVLHVF